ncbi:MAG: hypothetical protein ACKVZJ_08500 [Phycisphaerales bacterium]
MGAISLVAVLPARSAQFSLLVVDNGGVNGSLGAPITPSAGSFYVAPIVDTPQALPPSRAFVIENPEAEFSSYLTMGGSPVSANETANPPANVIGPQWAGRTTGPTGGPTQAIGIRYNFPIVVLDPGANPFGASPTHSVGSIMGNNTVFLGRLIVQRGERPVGPNIVLGIRFSHLANQRTAMVQYGVVHAVLDGPAQIFDPERPKSAPMPSDAVLVKSRLSGQITIAEWGDADIYDIYAVSESGVEPPPQLTIRPERPKIPKAPRAKKRPGRVPGAPITDLPSLTDPIRRSDPITFFPEYEMRLRRWDATETVSAGTSTLKASLTRRILVRMGMR